jgi:predicted nucleic acid-binding protein
MFLPDINFWLALIFNTHAHHPSAKSWMDGLNSGVCYF